MSFVTKYQMTITVDGVDYTDQISSWVFDNHEAPAGFLSFAAAALGGAREISVKATGAQNTIAGSFWDKAVYHTGSVVPFVARPHGGTASSTSAPSFTGYLKIKPVNGTMLGSDSGTGATDFATFDVEWTVTDVTGIGVSTLTRVTS